MIPPHRLAGLRAERSLHDEALPRGGAASRGFGHRLLDLYGARPAKARRTLELAAFCLETVQRSASSLHAFTLAGATATPLENSLALHQIAIAEEAESVPRLKLIPWRAASLSGS